MNILLYGNGGHAKVIKDCLSLLGHDVSEQFSKENPYNPDNNQDKKMIVAVGNNDTREKLVQEAKHRFLTIIHPSAVIASDVEIGEGTVILANAVIQAGAKIGKHCIINANVVIDHDVEISDYCSLYPCAYIGGESVISKGTSIEANTNVKRNSII